MADCQYHAGQRVRLTKGHPNLGLVGKEGLILSAKQESFRSPICRYEIKLDNGSTLFMDDTWIELIPDAR